MRSAAAMNAFPAGDSGSETTSGTPVSLPSRIGTLVDMTLKELEKALYFECYVVTDPGETPLQHKELLTDRKYREAREQFADGFKADMGAEAIRELL